MGGILKTTSGSERNKSNQNIHIKWDEDNIHETETDRGTRTRINEPKTPYVPPIDESGKSLDTFEELEGEQPYTISLLSLDPLNELESSDIIESSEQKSSKVSHKKKPQFSETRRKHYQMEAVPSMFESYTDDE